LPLRRVQGLKYPTAAAPRPSFHLHLARQTPLVTRPPMFAYPLPFPYQFTPVLRCQLHMAEQVCASQHALLAHHISTLLQGLPSQWHGLSFSSPYRTARILRFTEPSSRPVNCTFGRSLDCCSNSDQFTYCRSRRHQPEPQITAARRTDPRRATGTRRIIYDGTIRRYFRLYRTYTYRWRRGKLKRFWHLFARPVISRGLHVRL